MKKQIAVFWFRRDLRLQDNAALYHALRSRFPVLPVFIFDKNILDKLENKRDARLTFIHTCLSSLNDELQKINSGLVTLYDHPVQAWEKITDKYDVAEVYTNEDYEPYARQRDRDVSTFLLQKKIDFKSFKDHVIFNPLDILKDDGNPYTIYTPYKNKWRLRFTETKVRTFPSESYFKNFFSFTASKIPDLKQMSFQECMMSFPSQKVDHNLVSNYASCRNFPAIKGTSRLSIHLRFGTVSIRQLINSSGHLSEIWLNELIWREFYMMILFHFPHVATDAFKPRYDKIKWRNNEEEFDKWCRGQTGYPIVDSGMRELNATGFMHNRVRMITAGFLSKHLLIDWRWGESYFAEKLLDFEQSSNNGGWQWCAGTGCDAAPYFRIFNPYEQTKKFDPGLEYIRKWVPELEDPSYPKPIVDHKFARLRCLEAYKKALSV